MLTPTLSGPKTPSLLQSLRWLYQPIPFLNQCKREYGDSFVLRFVGFPPICVISKPEEIKQVFTGDPAALLAGQANVILKPILGAHSVLMLDGERHLQQRRLLMPPFHGERMHAYGAEMKAIVTEAIRRWPVGRTFSLQSEMQEITLQVILRTVFGLKPGPVLDQLADALKRVLSFGDHPSALLLIDAGGELRFKNVHAAIGRLSPWHRFQRLLGEVDAILYREIDLRRQAKSAGDDVLSMLIAARDEDGHAMTDAELRDEMMTLLIAGHETTATSLSWAVARLLRHPEVLTKLRTHLQKGDSEYLDAVIKETLRLDPIVPMVGRLLTRPLQLPDRELPAGVVVAPSVYLTQRRSDVWDEPERFLPERFISKKISPYDYFPFGGGSRRCIGMAFALYEMRIVLTEIVERTELAFGDGYKEGMTRRGVTFAPKGGLPVLLTTRATWNDVQPPKAD